MAEEDDEKLKRRTEFFEQKRKGSRSQSQNARTDYQRSNGNFQHSGFKEIF